MTPHGATSTRYSLKNFRLYERLQQHLHDVAIRRISGDILKLLLASKDRKFNQARNRMDIPHGLFGLKLKDFYDRRRQRDTVYLDVLDQVCKHALQQVKTCIVLDDLLEFTRNLFTAYSHHNMEPIKQEIADSYTLLTINETITNEYKQNMTLVHAVNSELEDLRTYKKIQSQSLKNKTYQALNNYIETTLVVNKLEFRTHMNYLSRTTDQYMYEMSTAEEHLQNTLNEICWSHRKEERVSDCNVLSQNIEINALKKQLAALSLEYDKQMEYYEGDIAYKTNMTDMMKNRLHDCTARLPFFAVEMVKLREWKAELERKGHEAARALITAKPKKSKNKKQEDKKGVMARKR